MSFQPDDIVGAYKIISLIGSGGAGQVFKAEHTITRRIEAIKALTSGRPGAREQAERFLREIRIQASLSHPNIASVHNAFWFGEDLVMAMELVPGESLRLILERGRIPLAVALDYACQALSALAYAHAHEVTHRDITPGNILVTAAGRVKLTDFGLAKAPTDIQLTRTGALLGSVYYMSPEQVQARPELDARTDIYSMGAVLYEMVTGLKPFDGDGAFAIMSAHVGQAPRPPAEIEPGLAPGLSEIILKALAKDPASRLQSAQEFRAALESVREVPVTKAAARHHTVGWALAAVVVMLAVFFARPAKILSPSPQQRAVELPVKMNAEPGPRGLRFARAIHAGAAVWSVALSESGKLLAAGTEEGAIEIWDTASGKRQAILRGHGAGVSAICFSRDEEWLASGSADRTARLWNLQGAKVRNVFRQGSFVAAVALSADGRWLACGSSDRRVKLWNLNRGGKPAGFREKSEPGALAFSPDGRLLAVGSPKSLNFWRADGSGELRSLGRPAAAIEFTPDGRCLALSAAHQVVKLWDTSKSRELASFDSHGPIRSMTVGGGGRLVALAAEPGAISILE